MKELLFGLITILSITFFTSCETQNDQSPSLTILELCSDKISVKPGSSETLTLTVTPSTTQSVIWKSSNEKVATVFYGKVSGINEGTAVITAVVGEDSVSCIVNVELTEYELVWSEEFEGNALDLNTWNIETGGNGWGNQEKQYYTERTENLRVADGKLYIEARKEEYQNNQYTSARINTKNKVDFAYGRIEASIKMAPGKGTWPAFWMLGYGSWPTCGEIDIVEYVGAYPTRILHAVHTGSRNGNNGRNWSRTYFQDNILDGFHTYAIEWEQAISNGDDCIRFYVDDQLTATLWQTHGDTDKSSWPFNSNFFIILNVALGGNLGGEIDDSIFNNTVIMEVDWVRVYQRR